MSSWRPTSPRRWPTACPRSMRERLLAETRARTPLSAISVMEQRLFLGERLLRDNDVASMACSLEQRVPLGGPGPLRERGPSAGSARATSRWAARPCCGVLACAASIRRCSSGPRAGLCCRSIAGSGAA